MNKNEILVALAERVLAKFDGAEFAVNDTTAVATDGRVRVEIDLSGMDLFEALAMIDGGSPAPAPKKTTRKGRSAPEPVEAPVSAPEPVEAPTVDDFGGAAEYDNDEF